MSRRGNVMLELALCATLLGGLFAGAAEYAQAMWVYNGLLDAVRDGARLAARPDIPCGPERDREIRAAVALAGTRFGLRESNVELRRDDEFVRITIRGFAAAAVFGERRFDGTPSLSAPAQGCEP